MVRHHGLPWPGRWPRFGLTHDRRSFPLDALRSNRNDLFNQLGIYGRLLQQSMGGFFHKISYPHNATAQISRAVGSVKGRRCQGLSIFRSVLIEVVSLNMIDSYQKMLRTRIAGLYHRLDGYTIGRRAVNRHNDTRIGPLEHRFQGWGKCLQSYRGIIDLPPFIVPVPELESTALLPLALAVYSPTSCAA